MRAVYLIVAVVCASICAFVIVGQRTVATKESSNADVGGPSDEVFAAQLAPAESRSTRAQEMVGGNDAVSGQQVDVVRLGTPNMSGQVAVTSFALETSQKAWEYHQRDREFFRQSFMGGPEALSGDRLRETFVLPEDLDADELALAIDAESVDVVERLTRLSEDYLVHLDSAIESALISGEPDSVPASEVAGRKYDDEFHRVIVNADDHQCVYRIRLSDHPEFSELYASAQRLIAVRRHKVEEMVGMVTGEVRYRQGEQTEEPSR